MACGASSVQYLESRYWTEDAHILEKTSFKTSNKFSAHDNRDVLASDAEYFGVIPGTRTTGRKLAKPELNQHLTDEKFLAHYGRQLTRYDYNTIYSDNYRGCQTTQPTMCCRSYPRQYLPAEHRPRPEQTGCLPPVAEDDNRPCRPTTEVLAITQMPFVRNTGAWKYSYNGIPRCYPAGFSQINDRNPYPGFFLRPQQTDNPANSICKATA